MYSKYIVFLCEKIYATLNAYQNWIEKKNVQIYQNSLVVEV